MSVPAPENPATTWSPILTVTFVVDAKPSPADQTLQLELPPRTDRLMVRHVTAALPGFIPPELLTSPETPIIQLVTFDQDNIMRVQHDNTAVKTSQLMAVVSFRCSKNNHDRRSYEFFEGRKTCKSCTDRNARYRKKATAKKVALKDQQSSEPAEEAARNAPTTRLTELAHTRLMFNDPQSLEDFWESQQSTIDLRLKHDYCPGQSRRSQVRDEMDSASPVLSAHAPHDAEDDLAASSVSSVPEAAQLIHADEVSESIDEDDLNSHPGTSPVYLTQDERNQLNLWFENRPVLCSRTQRFWCFNHRSTSSKEPSPASSMIQDRFLESLDFTHPMHTHRLDNDFRVQPGLGQGSCTFAISKSVLVQVDGNNLRFVGWKVSLAGQHDARCTKGDFAHKQLTHRIFKHGHLISHPSAATRAKHAG
ncbi:hypothetical protein CAOG_08804 [Capsaspora owczarzaki ATCC 30864]|nr:hypothetical protein CAOG_08804 [Capsaspora owczarzaki ATCC 30864]|eukprot:XP_011270444.1 hypothetical protein CAOG_08804 [Capsaspora owczarzaki ATCC 30864]